MGKRALITGASSGIGRALAFEYARQGFELLLAARDEARLQAVAAECAERYRAGAEVFAADLADAAAADALVLAVSQGQFHTLVNNAGFALKGEFAATAIADELRMLSVQLAAMLRLTKAVLPAMIARGEGRIVNIASVYSFSAVPKQAVYSACKSFMLSFSGALGNELRGKGVRVTVVCPGTTRTEFRRRAGINEENLGGMAAEEVARIAFAASAAGKRVAVPGFWNKVFAAVSKHLPLPAAASLASRINDRRGVNR
jgi:hypothetical protein